jgi:hypothetical protein
MIKVSVMCANTPGARFDHTDLDKGSRKCLRRLCLAAGIFSALSDGSCLDAR